mgnify:FL=1
MSDPLLLSRSEKDFLFTAFTNAIVALNSARVELLNRHDETGVDVFNPCSLLLTAEKKLIDFSKTFGLIEEMDQ